MVNNIREKIEKGAVHTIFVIEMAGRPAEYVKKVLDELVGHFEKQKGVELINKKMHEPEPVEKLFSCFAEIEFIAEKFQRLLELVFYFMPSSIEIVAPEHIKLNVADANALANDLSTRLHQYDDIAKKEQIEKAILIKQFQEKLKEREEQEKKEEQEQKPAKKEEKSEQKKEKKKKRIKDNN